MNLPGPVQAGVEAALRRRAGADVAVAGVRTVGGGCISPGARLELSTGERLFLKWAGPGDVPPGLFREEARSLKALAEAGAVRVPRVVALHDPDERGAAGDAAGPGASAGTREPAGSQFAGPRNPAGPHGSAGSRKHAETRASAGSRSGAREPAGSGGAGGASGPAWLLLEWLEPGRSRAGAWARLGRELAALHRHTADAYGWPEDNFIGSLPQANGRLEAWPDFWRELRLAPQIRLAADAGAFSRANLDRFDRLLDRLDEVLHGAGDDGASLLHGDLWSGNVHFTADGLPAVLDPSSYHGHREVDLAMTELFGGFHPDFHMAYHEAWPLGPEYAGARRTAYQLYYLLVHVNLFGGGYVGQTLAALRQLA